MRPLRVLTALHWLVNKSELYKRSVVEIDTNWFKEVTESSDETVREFLEVSKEHNKEKHKQNPTLEEDANLSSLAKDSKATDDYDSDHFSEIDTNEQAGNVDTLVDDERLENKCDKIITFAPGEGLHLLLLLLYFLVQHLEQIHHIQLPQPPSFVWQAQVLQCNVHTDYV